MISVKRRSDRMTCPWIESFQCRSQNQGWAMTIIVIDNLTPSSSLLSRLSFLNSYIFICSARDWDRGCLSRPVPEDGHSLIRLCNLAAVYTWRNKKRIFPAFLSQSVLISFNSVDFSSLLSACPGTRRTDSHDHFSVLSVWEVFTFMIRFL